MQYKLPNKFYKTSNVAAVALFVILIFLNLVVYMIEHKQALQFAIETADTANFSNLSELARPWILLYGTILFLVYLLLVYGFHKIISIRTEKILNALKFYMAGNRHPKIEVSGFDEIGALANRIQELFNRVNATEELLIAKTLELEKINIQLNLAKEAAEKLSQSKSEFLANMSHEIRTPLSVILGATDMLIEAPSVEKIQARYLSILKKSGVTLLSLINDILDVSQIEAGVLNLTKENFNLGYLLEDTLELHTMSASQKDLQLNYILDSNLHLEYIGDPKRIKQVLDNLITNAIKYTDKGFITVTLRPNHDKNVQGEILVEIKDTGIGIPESFRNKIFDNFSQGDLSTTKKYGGVGLGLAISKHLVSIMGGEIRFESIPNVGSQFFFTLKLQPDLKNTILLTTAHEVNNSVVNPVGSDNTHSHKFRILIVEDNADIRTLLKASLRTSYIEMTECENGLLAIEKVKVSNFDLILMDIQMPVMDGFTALKIIREWEALHFRKPHLIMALTAYAMKEDRTKCLNAGFDYYMSKPIKLQELRDFISQLQLT